MPKQIITGRYFPEDIFQYMFVMKGLLFLIKVYLVLSLGYQLTTGQDWIRTRLGTSQATSNYLICVPYGFTKPQLELKHC